MTMRSHVLIGLIISPAMLLSLLTAARASPDLSGTSAPVVATDRIRAR